MLPDRLEFLPDGRFQLLGRADRVVKVAEKRVDLDGIEAQLLASDAVAAVRVLPLESARGRTVLAAVIVPTDAGWSMMAANGKRAVCDHLRDDLRTAVEPAAIPRRWRFVRALPETSHGKTPHSALRDLFQPMRGRVTEPGLVARDEGEGRLVLHLRPSPELVYFQGHFESVPILPGVAQLHWAIEAGRQALGIASDFERLEAVKFFRTIRPDTDLVLSLTKSGSGRLTFSLSSGDGQHASGRVIFAEAP